MGAACHAAGTERTAQGRVRWLLVGAPNVGKSALFGQLTGIYTTVSNYPGTSVEITRGRRLVGGHEVEIVDTPGAYSLLAVTEDELVARRAMVEGGADTIVHVVDASHLERAIPVTLQLLTLGRPVVVACNLMDEARARRAAPDVALLAERLGVAVVGTVATTGQGLPGLVAAAACAQVPKDGWAIPTPFAEIVGRLAESLGRTDGSGPDILTSELALAGDAECEQVVSERVTDRWAEAVAGRNARWESAEGFALALATSRRMMAVALLDGVVPPPDRARSGSTREFDRFLLSPWTGFPIALLVLYAGFYQFVGKLGAGTAVDWIERVVFGRWLTPAATTTALALVPWPAVRDLLVGPYGLFTLGVRYAVAIVLPIVTAFFLVFALLEDLGYLPRLALMLDRTLKRIGLSGRAVIPLILGFGCNTMATLVTRTLETRRERVIATLLLALAIPCSAQLGVVLGILSVSSQAVAVWALVLVAVFLGVGRLAAVLVPGGAPTFYLELPPLRRPSLRNVLVKTGTRMRWYFAEIFPLFLLASVLLWVGDLTGVLGRATAALEPVVRLLGLPPAAASAFLYGFFRRDFGAAGLYDLARSGALGTAALTTAAVTITLFVPCIAQFLMMAKERGLKVATTVLVVATAVAFVVGGLVGWMLRTIGGWS